MVEWLAGNRLRGTTAERPNLGLPSGSVGGWVEVGRTTLGSAGDDIDITSLPDKRYYHVLVSQLPTGSAVGKLTLNNDSGSNYARRFSVNGASDTAQSSIAEIGLTTTETNPNFQSIYLANLSSKEKLGFIHNVRQNTVGAGNAPNRAEQVFKWANTSNAISRVDVYNSSTGSFDTGSEVVVLGYDPDDTHTTNFWEELDSVTLGSAGDTLQSNTFTAKKYLWIQYFLQGSATDLETQITFNADSGSNYTQRRSQNGGSDVTNINQSRLEPIVNKNNYNYFGNMFFINNASNEKLGIHHSVEQTGTGAGNAPSRHEGVMKWINTSDQITSIKIFNNGAADYEAGTTIKVWGSD